MEPKNISLSSKEAILPQPIEGEETKAAAVETALAALNPSIEEGTPPSLEGRVTLTPASTSKEWQWVAVNYIILDSRESSQEAEKEDAERKKAALEEVRAEITRAATKKQTQKHEDGEFDAIAKESKRLNIRE